MAFLKKLGVTLLLICAFTVINAGILEEYSEYYEYSEETEKPRTTDDLFLTTKKHYSVTGILKRPGLKIVNCHRGGGGGPQRH